MCAENPFVQMFTPEQGESEKGRKEKKHKKKSFHPRTEEEIRQLVAEWDPYVHPRARDSFGTQAGLEDVLAQLASGIQRTQDPVLGEEHKCVLWYGHVTHDKQEAVIHMVKPGETSKSITYVNRVLPFIFATDESFEQLMKLPKEPFKMVCGDQMCVHLVHIAIQTQRARSVSGQAI